MLVSAGQQHESDIRMHVSPQPTHLGHLRAPRWAPCAMLEASHTLAISHMVVFVYQSHFPKPLHALLPPSPCPQVHLGCHRFPVSCVTFVSHVFLISLILRTPGKPQFLFLFLQSHLSFPLPIAIVVSSSQICQRMTPNFP